MIETPGPPVGREGEISRLQQLRQEADGGGRLLLLAAEAGGGKTTVVNGFLDRLPTDVIFGVGRAVDLGDEVAPLLPVTTAMTNLARSQAALDQATDGRNGPVSPVDDGDAVPDHDHSLLSLAATLYTPPAGTVLVLEDLHWADTATLAFVRLLAERLMELPLLVIVTFRSDMPRNHVLRQTLGEISRRVGVTRIDLPPLRRSDMANLWIRHHGEPADLLTLDQLEERTGGNAFYVTEAIAAGPDFRGLPSSVEDALVHRVEQLPKPVVELVRTAAIAGPVDVEDLAAVTSFGDDVFADSLRAAIEAGVLVLDDQDDGIVTFRHALLAEAALQPVLPFEKRAVHQLLGQRLDHAARPETIESATRTARHWLLAGVAERAFETAVIAAERATAQQHFAVAFVQLSTVLNLWDSVGDPETACGRPWHLVLLEAAEAASELGRADEAVRLGARAFDEVTNDPHARADAAWRYGYILYTDRRIREAYRFIEAESQRVIDQPPHPHFARLLVARIGIAMSAGDYTLGTECDQRVTDMVDQVGDLQAKGRLASFRGACLTAAGDLATGLPLLEEAGDLLSEAGDHSFAANARLTRITAGLVNDHIDDLIELAERSIEAAAHAPASRRMALGGAMAELLHYAGRTSRALDGFQRGPARLVWRTAAERALTRATLALDTGDLNTARELANSPDIGAAGVNPPMALRAALLRCRVLHADGQSDQAGADLVHEVEVAARQSQVLHGALALSYAWEWVEHDSDWHSSLVDVSHRIVRYGGIVASLSPVGAWLAVLKANISDDDADGWQVAIAACEAAGMQRDRVRAMVGAAKAYLATGERGLAADVLEQASNSASMIDDQQLRLVVDETRTRAGLAGKHRPDDRFGLTNRELEVLELLSEGRTNTEIAAALFISAKTASVHVSNLLPKLDVSNRRDAGRLARELGIRPSSDRRH